MKKFPISMGVDDARFNFKAESKSTQLIGVVCQGIRMVKVVRNKIDIDGNDSTVKLIELVKQNEKLVQYVLTHTITFGGFNIYDIQKVYEKTGKPIIAITESEIDFDSVKKALIKKFPGDYKAKLKLILKAGNLYETYVETAGGNSNIYFHCKGIEIEEAELLLKNISIDSKLPEPVRLAHLIGRIF
ncbi:MAG: endonuclease dU [Promethearchaeota archaeon]